MPEQISIQLVPGAPAREWHPQCQTSAGYSVEVYAFGPGDSLSSMGTVSGCVRCDEVADDA